MGDWNSGSGGDTWNDPASTTDFNDGYNAGDSADVGLTEAPTGGADGGFTGCRNCGQEGHFSRDCPEPRKMGACFNCGEEGHSKADCTKPRVFTGTCKTCSETGHRAAECPSKPKFCLRCNAQGEHDTKDCTNNYFIDLSAVADVSENTAWAKLSKASSENDLDDFKTGMIVLQKCAPELTYQAMEAKFRKLKYKFYLIGLQKEAGEAYTYVDLQGVPDKTYCIGVYKSPKCQRPTLVDKWPATPEENMTRLGDAGVPLERHIPYCRTCEKYGHASRECDQERVVVEGPQIQCALCGELGHRVRDCKEPRKKERGPMECRVCGGEHMAKDCDQRPAIKCRNCEQEGHKASDCTEPRVQRCRNCNEAGHVMRECKIPLDYEKLTCRNCGEKGHLSIKLCNPEALKKKQDADAEAAAAAAGDENNNGYGDDGATADAGYGGGDFAAPANGGGW